MPTEAREDALTVKVDNYLNGLELRLFKNNITPDQDTVLADFTEADFPGYSSQGPLDFGAVFLNGSDNAESDTSVHTFTCTGVPGGGSQDIYGWYTEFPTGRAGPCARFSAPVPITLTGAGQSLSVQILFEDGGLA